MRKFLLLLPALPFLATFAPLSLARAPKLPVVPVLSFEAVALDEDEPGKRRLGKLSYLGGWELRSNDPRFGGISAMHVESGEVTAISDAGTLIRFSLPGATGPGVSIMPLFEGPGSASNKLDRDTEAMAVHGNQAWIAYEGRDAIWRYDRSSWKSEAHASPLAMRKWRANSGAEAMVRLQNGEFLILSEGKPGGEGPTDALLFRGDPAVEGTPVVGLRYAAPEGYRITDAAQMPDGRLLFLNRRISLLDGLAAKLTIGNLPELREGTTLTGREIAHFDAPITTDNYEALSVVREGGRTILWIASDDNLTPLQRTLLLKLEFVE